ncbi:MAG: hypothetical protein OEV42_11680 [Deltaproteobacteria bacterium]|nr:hypothetical protein [Deltaproteobacteria bacterium]
MKKFLFILVISIPLFSIACEKQKNVWVSGWKQTSPMTTARAGAALVVANGHIYAIGGVDGRNFINTTEYAKIMNDGSLGPWKKGPPLNEPRGFIDAVFYKGNIYVVGGGKGQYGKVLLRSTERARVLPDGSLSSWQMEKHLMTMRRRCTKVTAANDMLFVYGGFSGDMLKSVEHARIMEDGTLDEWYEEGELLTVLRYINGVKMVGGLTYVVGGHHETEGIGIQDVEWSKVIDEAGYEEWKKTSPLKTGRYGLSTATNKKRLYAIGGITGAEYLDSIEMATANENGELSSWQLTTPLSSPRSMLGSAVYKDWIYILGGTNSDGYQNSVEYATFNDKGHIGYWAEEGKAKVVKEKAKEKTIKKQSNLPNTGIVKYLLQTKRYTYILVSKNGTGEWLAGPQINLKVGTKIHYSKGVFMSNFYSKELKKNFPAILFVSKIEVE